MIVKGKKILKLLLNIIKVMIYIALALFILVVCMQRFSNNKISFFNYRMFTVVSQSMTPKYDIGDVLISKQVDPSKVKEGDVVSYLGGIGDFDGKVITHRVVNVEKHDDGKYYYRTKGDANIVEDPIVSEDQLYGVVIYKSAILSLIYRIVGTKIGFFLFIIIPIMFIIGSEMVTSLLEKEEERRQQLKESKESKEKEEKNKK